MYHVKEAAQLSGVSVKTLHHYDKIGLLVPAKSENGYRTYSQDDLERLQVILYYKYLGFSLEKIAELLSQDEQALLPHLVRQLEYLQQERDRLDTLISTLQKTIQDEKGERKMTMKEKFAGFTYEDNHKYHQEAVEEYGQEVMSEALTRQMDGKKNLPQLSIEFFKVWQRICSKACQLKQQKIKSRQPSSYKPFALTVLTAHCKSLPTSVRAMSTIQNSRKISINLEQALPSTQQM